MEITKKQKKYLEEKFNLFEDETIYEIENWTNGGVDMSIIIDKQEDEDLTTQLENYVDNFDIDEEIDLYREDENYKNNFTIRESIKDFEDWLEDIKNNIKELKECL